MASYTGARSAQTGPNPFYNAFRSNPVKVTQNDCRQRTFSVTLDSNNGTF